MNNPVASDGYWVMGHGRGDFQANRAMRLSRQEQPVKITGKNGRHPRINGKGKISPKGGSEVAERPRQQARFMR